MFSWSVTLDLNKVPKPAKSPKNCNLKLLKKDGSVPTLNLFKNKRCKGWWPMQCKTEEGMELVVRAASHLINVKYTLTCFADFQHRCIQGIVRAVLVDTGQSGG